VLRATAADAFAFGAILTTDLPALGANPTGTIGLAAVNGVATTYIRSDGAPALSQAIAPTWTATHRWGTTNKIEFRDAALYISSKNDGYLDFDADTAFRFNTGNVGIGRSPTYIVDIQTNQDASTLCRITNTNNHGSSRAGYTAVSSGGNLFEMMAMSESYGTARWQDKGVLYSAGNAGMVIEQHDNFPIDFWTNATHRMTITGAGNVGIGTTTPSYKLQVHGGTAGLNVVTTVLSSFFNGISLGGWQSLGYDSSGTGLVLGGYRASQWNNVQIHTSGSEKIRITSSGNVGIGTTTPLLDAGSASGDFTGTGLHVKRSAANSKTYLILEGDSYYPNSGGHSANSIVFCDRTGGSNTKMFEIEHSVNSSGDNLLFKSLNDDTTAKNSVLALDGNNQYITHYHATNDIVWQDCPNCDSYEVDCTGGYITITAGGVTRYIQLYKSLIS
jgi:hypothetical protein